MAVNWKKGFRRIALILSVLAAIAGAVVGFWTASVEADPLMMPLIAFWGAVGFGGVWLVYLILERFVLWTANIVLWVSRGFHDTGTEQKSGDTNKQETKRYGFRRTEWGIVVAAICASWSIVIILAECYGSLDSRFETLSTWSLVGLCALVGILSGACGFLVVYVVYGLVKWIRQVRYFG